MLDRFWNWMHERRVAYLKSEAAEITASGGTVNYLSGYFEFLKAINEGGSTAATAVAKDGRKFRRLRVQIAAAQLMIDPQKYGEHLDDVARFARVAFISAAGHNENEKKPDVPEFTPSAELRREAATAEWDRYALSDPTTLLTRTMFPKTGHKAFVAAIFIFLALAATALYVDQVSMR